MSDHPSEGAQPRKKHESTLGRASALRFASTADIDEFVATLEKFERGEISPDEWRAFRLVRGVYGQRQDDVQMFRVKVPQGILSAEALGALADACEIWSRGFGHITTRQNIQMHFLLLRDAEACMRRLADAGLTTREACGNSVRNIVGCPYAGVCPGEPFDVTPYAQALTRYFLRHPLASTLPRKFKIAFGGCEPDCAMGAIHDIGFQARVRGGDGQGERGFRVVVGGGTATLPQSARLLHEFLPAGELLEMAEAILRVFEKHGNRKNRMQARMKFVIRKIGFEAFAALYQAERDAVRAAGVAPLPWDPQSPPEEAAPDDVPRLAPPSAAAIAARVAAAAVRGPGIVPARPPALPVVPDGGERAHFLRTNVRAQKQAGFATVVAHVPMGDLTGAQFRVLAELALAFSDGTVRLTQHQDLVFRFVREADVAALHERLCAAGLGLPDANTIADVTSCPGAESCKLAVTQSRGLGRELGELFAARPDLTALGGDALIKVSGCPNGCGQHHIAALGFQGAVRRLGERVAPQYHLLVGGGFDAGVAHFGRRSVKIPARRVAAAVERLLGYYREKRTRGESAAAFFRRVDLGEVEALLADLAAMTAADARELDYVDIAEDHAFKVETQEGECMASRPAHSAAGKGSADWGRSWAAPGGTHYTVAVRVGPSSTGVAISQIGSPSCTVRSALTERTSAVRGAVSVSDSSIRAMTSPERTTAPGCAIISSRPLRGAAIQRASRTTVGEPLQGTSPPSMRRFDITPTIPLRVSWMAAFSPRPRPPVSTVIVGTPNSVATRRNERAGPGPSRMRLAPNASHRRRTCGFSRLPRRCGSVCRPSGAACRSIPKSHREITSRKSA
jgi:sulfite reductase beta subunit-like hemoprotein